MRVKLGYGGNNEGTESFEMIIPMIVPIVIALGFLS